VEEFLQRRTAWFPLALFLGLAIVLAGSQLITARAQEKSTLRKTTITVDTIEYDWWLVSWQSDRVACELSVEHEGKPTPQEVFEDCGRDIYETWIESKPCTTIGEDSAHTTCSGYYLMAMGSHNDTRTIKVDLPLPSVEVSLTGCENAPATGPCTGHPALKFTGVEPLPNEQIISIQGDVGGRPFSCSGNSCSVALVPTGAQGITVNFWADSSFGDSTEAYTAQVRMVPWGDFTNPEETASDRPAFYVDVISTQFRAIAQRDPVQRSGMCFLMCRDLQPGCSHPPIQTNWQPIKCCTILPPCSFTMAVWTFPAAQMAGFQAGTLPVSAVPRLPGKK